jgi:hypothetical protein
MIFRNFIFFLFVSVAFFSVAQQNSPVVKKASPGTFQLIQTSKVEAALTTEEYDQILLLVEQQRDNANFVNIDYSPYLRIKIVPRNILNSSSFVPYAESIYLPE